MIGSEDETQMSYWAYLVRLRNDVTVMRCIKTLGTSRSRFRFSKKVRCAWVASGNNRRALKQLDAKTAQKRPNFLKVHREYSDEDPMMFILLILHVQEILWYFKLVPNKLPVRPIPPMLLPMFPRFHVHSSCPTVCRVSISFRELPLCKHMGICLGPLAPVTS